MNQLAYLEALGVDIYLPRQPLVGARPSRFELRPAGAIETPAIDTEGRPARLDSGVTLEQPAIKPASVKPEPTEVIRPPQAARPTKAAAVAFSLLVVPVSNRALFISELRSAPLRPDLEANVMQFLQDVCCALGESLPAKLTPVYFQWPMSATNTALEQGEAAARETLRGFISQQLSDCKPSRLVLMGQSVARYIADAEQIPTWLQSETMTLCKAPSLGQLFAHPARKAELWAALQAG